jgi:nitrogen fixation protein NifB
MGDNPKQILKNYGVTPVEMSGFIEMGLQAVYDGGDLSKLKGKRQTAGYAKIEGCQVDGLGCG